jgi:hypothetical protein
MKYPKILFFINGTTPSKKEVALAATFGPNVSFRNAKLIGAEAMEFCEAVTGAVPEKYASKYPSAKDAIAAFNKKLNEDVAEAFEEDKPKPEEKSSKKMPPPVWQPNA